MDVIRYIVVPQNIFRLDAAGPSMQHPGQLVFTYTTTTSKWTESRSNLYPTFMIRSDQRQFLIESLFGSLIEHAIPVKIECVDDTEFVATIPDLNMTISGESVGDALAALKEYVEMSIESFREERDSLGPEPARQLLALESYIGEGPGNEHQ